MLLLLPIFTFLVAVDASAKLLVGKYFVSKYPVANQENVFEYQIINTGDDAAINVELSDRDSFPTDRFEILKGSTNVKFAAIPPHTTAYHHIVVVPRIPQPIEDNDITVDYTDSKTGKTSRTSTVSEKKDFTHFLDEAVMRKLNGTNFTPFLVFAGLTLPLTAFPAFFYWRSKCRYSIQKKE